MTMKHPNQSREVRAGALAALRALQQAELMAGGYETTGDGEEIPQGAIQAEIDHRQSMVSTFLKAAGKLPPHAQGFNSVLAEYIDFGLRIGEPDLSAWKPEAAMTAREIEKSRAKWLADMLAN